MTDLVETVGLDEVEKTLFKQMNELRLENLLCDVRFNVNGTIIPCHRLVLSALSPYFKTMFNGNFKESISDTVTMNDIETETFEEILNAMYTASIRFHAGNAYFILKASHLFQLEMIQKACLSYINKNLEIHFLVETCVFARNVGNAQYNSLYSKCSKTITSSIIEYGKTDSFRKIPFDVFKKILCDHPGGFTESKEELVILLINKWSKQNNASCKDIEMLLDAAPLKSTKLISSSVMSQLLVSSDDKFMMNDAHSEGTEELHCNDSNLPLNLYLNAIDVETGQRGWGVLKLSGGLDKFVLSSFHPSGARRKKVCRIGSKLYCFDTKPNFFSYDEKDDVRIALPTPSDLDIIDQFEITAVETSVYLMITKPHFLIWCYNCETKTWQNILRKNEHENIYCNVSACTFSSGSFYILAQKDPSSPFSLWYSNYIFSITPTNGTLIVKELAGILLTSDEISYLRAFDGFITIYTVYGTKHVEKMNAFKILNLTKNQWLSVSRIEESRHVNFLCFHYNGSMYFVENDRAMIPNQRYDLSSSSWINLPFLPKQITMPNTNQVLATGEVFGCDVNP